LQVLVEQLVKPPQGSLAERRAMAHYMEHRFSHALKSIEAAAGFEVPVVIHSDFIAQRLAGRAAELPEIIERSFIAPLVKALQAVGADSVGKAALLHGLKKIELGGDERYTLSFIQGVLKIGIYATSFKADIEGYIREIQKQLESVL